MFVVDGAKFDYIDNNIFLELSFFRLTMFTVSAGRSGSCEARNMLKKSRVNLWVAGLSVFLLCGCQTTVPMRTAPCTGDLSIQPKQIDSMVAFFCDLTNVMYHFLSN